MNDDVIADLKQFFAATVSQQLTLQLEEQLTKHLAPIHDRIDRLEQKMDDGFAGIAETIDQLNEHLEQRLENHETRITSLENQPSQA